jgi:L-fuconolactonase
MIFDAHHHLWKVDRGDYRWMATAPPSLTRDYLVEDLRPHLRKAEVTRTILVQAAETEAETDFIAGVTGWLDMTQLGFPERLAHYRGDPKFLAIRPMLQDLPDDAWILQTPILENLRHLNETGFPFEFLTLTRHLPHVLTALRQTPGLHSVIDHLSKPPIASGKLEPWASLMRSVAQFPNVHCKLSGLVTEADRANWSPTSLAPYVNHVIDVFGTDRVMFGSDWPVCRLAAEYGEVINALRTVLSPRLGPRDMEKVFYSNAMRFYRGRP